MTIIIAFAAGVLTGIGLVFACFYILMREETPG